MPNNRIIARAWERYREIAVDEGTPEAQVAELEQAFFSGAAILLLTVLRMLSPDPDPTEADLRFMTDLQDEVDEFAAVLDERLLGIPAKH